MYRLHSALAPTGDDADDLLCGCARQLQALGDLARAADLRLSFHPYSQVTLNALDQERADRSVALLGTMARLLDAMALGPEAVIVLHVGGVYGRADDALGRFVRRYEALPRTCAAGWSWKTTTTASLGRRGRRPRRLRRTPGVRQLHHLVYNPAGIPTREALAAALARWPAGVTPKIHFASPRTEMRPLPGSNRIKVPIWTEHSDFVNPFEFIAFLRDAATLTPDEPAWPQAFDVMLECKARDLAVLKLRQDLARFAPDLASGAR
jgi:UV DNA damage endonuclease